MQGSQFENTTTINKNWKAMRYLLSGVRIGKIWEVTNGTNLIKITQIKNPLRLNNKFETPVC